MPRTVINLDPDDKAWLDMEARRQRVSMAELVRRAVQRYRVSEDVRPRPTLIEALARTAGLWMHGDGLEWQQRLRDEFGEGRKPRADPRQLSRK